MPAKPAQFEAVREHPAQFSKRMLDGEWTQAFIKGASAEFTAEIAPAQKFPKIAGVAGDGGVKFREHSRLQQTSQGRADVGVARRVRKKQPGGHLRE